MLRAGVVLALAATVSLAPACRLKVAERPDAAAAPDARADGGAPPADAAPPGDAAADGGGLVDAAPPFTCDPEPATSPVLDGVLAIDPAEPHPGDVVTVLVRSQAVDRGAAPPMPLEVRSAAGTRQLQPNAMAGGRAVYYYAVSDLALGDHCLLGRIDGSPEIAGRFTVTPRPAGPPRCQGGVYKVTTHHQWTCAEQPQFGNEIHVQVLDAQGQGVPSATLRIGWPDTTLRPLYNDTTPPTPSDVPETVQTGADGWFRGYNYWPTNQNGYTVFNLAVEGCASDVATEITTGWWETDNDGCRWCDPSYTARNVWGHWSYTVVFRLDPAAASACVVPSDHAGQGSGCRVEHIHHDPAQTACHPVP